MGSLSIWHWFIVLIVICMLAIPIVLLVMAALKYLKQ